MREPSSTSPAGSADGPRPSRSAYSEELAQLRLQVELMGLRVDENLERMRAILVGDADQLVPVSLTADDEIDAMNVSLTERCYSLLLREGPVAGDLRLIVSVLRVTSELERIGDLALRVVKLAPEHHLLAADERCHDILTVMADEAVSRYRTVLAAWATEDLAAATEMTVPSKIMVLATDQLTERVLRLSGDEAVATAVRVTTAARALDRIADHTVVLGARLRYLITGDPAHLAVEVR